MPTVREIKTLQSISAVNRIKNLVRKEPNKNWVDVPKEFVEKRNYMQSDEFLKDEHNIKMFDFGEKLGELREKIKQEIIDSNQFAKKEELTQGINGFARIKKYLDQNNKMNFSDVQSFHTPYENKYAILKKFKIGNLAREAKNKLGIK